MKTTSGQKIKIGIFAIAGIAVLVMAIFFIGNQKSLFTSTFTVNGLFNNVSGLQVGNNARFAGINVGVVDNIQIKTDSSVMVSLTLNDDVKKFIKKDSKLSIGSDGLMGDKLVMITPGGSTSNTEVNNGDQLAVVNPLDVDKLITKFTKIADNAGDLVQGLASIVNKVNSGKGSIGRLLNNDKIARDLEGTVTQAKTTMANVHKTTTTLNEDLTAAQSNFLLKGFFNKKKKAAKAKQDSIKKVEKAKQDSLKKVQSAKQ